MRSECATRGRSSRILPTGHRNIAYLYSCVYKIYLFIIVLTSDQLTRFCKLSLPLNCIIVSPVKLSTHHTASGCIAFTGRNSLIGGYLATDEHSPCPGPGYHDISTFTHTLGHTRRPHFIHCWLFLSRQFATIQVASIFG